MKQKLLDKLNQMLDKGDLETLNEMYESCENGEWEGAECMFGHADDCLEKGQDLGRAGAIEEIIHLIKSL